MPTSLIPKRGKIRQRAFKRIDGRTVILRAEILRATRFDKTLSRFAANAADKMISLTLSKQGRCIEYMRADLTSEARGGFALAMAERGYSVNLVLLGWSMSRSASHRAAGRKIIAPLVSAAFATAQKALRKMAPETEFLPSHDSLMEAGADGWETLMQDVARRTKRRCLILSARAAIAKCRAACTGRKAGAKFRGMRDLVVRALRLELARIAGDPARTFAFRPIVRAAASEQSKSIYNRRAELLAIISPDAEAETSPARDIPPPPVPAPYTRREVYAIPATFAERWERDFALGMLPAARRAIARA